MNMSAQIRSVSTNRAEAQAQAWYKDLLSKTSKGEGAMIVNLTPEMSQLLLNNNPTNRKIRPSNIKKIASELISGRWKFNGQTIGVDKNGALLNGQHRSTAII